MDGEYILTIDCGTQSARAILFNDEGALINIEKKSFEPYFSVYPGWAEQNPEVYWEAICKCCNGLKAKDEEKWEKIIGVCLTTQRDTVVNVDKYGNVLRPAIVWLDQRMAKCDDPMPILNSILFSTVGMKNALEITRRKSKANWIRENQPDIWDKTYKFLLLSGYLTYKFTGEFVDSIANQIAHLPFDYKKKSWPDINQSYRWSMFGIDTDKLYELVEPGTIIGGINKEAAEATGIKEGTPFIAGGSDKGCETLGTGCLSPDSVSLSFGTTATAQTTTKEYIEPLTFMPAYPSIIPGCYNPEVEIFRGYWMISWFKKEFCSRELIESSERNISPEEILNERLNSVPPGCQGLVLQPFWGPGLKTPSAKGSIIGFGDIHTRAHIYRAIIEGINYALIDGVERIESKSKVKVQKVMVSGGGSQSDTICQITADMFNKPVYKERTYETSGLGAAITGFVGAKVYASYDEAVKKMIHYNKIYYPNTENVRVYSDLYNKVYKKIYPKLQGIYKEIQSITKYPEIY